jgi:hypothetical protein
MKSLFGNNSQSSKNTHDPHPSLPSAAGDLIPHPGNRNVFKCSNEDGELVAKKFQKRWALLESEARMLSYATRYLQVKGPKLRKVFLNGDERVMITDFDPGV